MDNFLKIVENIKRLDKAGLQKMQLKIYFPEMNVLKSLVKINSNISYVTTPIKTFTLRQGKDQFAKIPS